MTTIGQPASCRTDYTVQSVIQLAVDPTKQSTVEPVSLHTHLYSQPASCPTPLSDN